MRKKGFTLIELLVVIAIIAMLLAIVTPALNKAKQVVRRVICASNIRQVGLSARSYADSYKGKLVPMAHIVGASVHCYSDALDGHTVSSSGPILPWMAVISQIVTGSAVTNPNGILASSQPKGLNLGVLYDNDFFENPEAFYCPAQPTNSTGPFSFTYKTYTNNDGYAWGKFGPAPTGAAISVAGAVRTSYNYWVGRSRTGNAYNVRYSELNADKVLIVDNLQDWYVVPHRTNSSSSSSPQGVSALFADNHVEFCINKEAFKKDASYTGIPRIWGNDTPETYSDGPGDSALWFETLLKWIPQGN